MLTGDENIVEAQIVVQYRVADPSKFLFRLREPEVALGAATEVALRSTVGSMTIDQVMIEERAKVQDDARVFIQRLMDAYESGLVITEVKLQAADPPDAVRDAFQDVVRAFDLRPCSAAKYVDGICRMSDVWGGGPSSEFVSKLLGAAVSPKANGVRLAKLGNPPPAFAPARFNVSSP